VRAIVFGGYGVFGAQLARELASAGVTVTVAGRNRRQADKVARTLGPSCHGLAVDMSDPQECLQALCGQVVAVNCAGSLADMGPALLDACLAARCHYADLAVERASAALVRQRSETFRQRGLVAAYGCSSLPGLSGALALAAHAGRKDCPERARITLFIGNDNPKGQGAVESFLETLGKPIAAPQGTLWGFGGREVVRLPPPFARRGVFNFDSPDYDLLPDLLGVKAVKVKVGFELRPVNYAFAALARTGWRLGSRTARLVSAAGEALRWLGCSGGAVMAELFYADGSVRRASLAARNSGQRMALLPCAMAALHLCQSGPERTGSLTAYELLGAEQLLQEMTRCGFTMYN